jgi:hypothetical protein
VIELSWISFTETRAKDVKKKAIDIDEWASTTSALMEAVWLHEVDGEATRRPDSN